jgi:hypothetical protein
LKKRLADVIGAGKSSEHPTFSERSCRLQIYILVPPLCLCHVLLCPGKCRRV